MADSHNVPVYPTPQPAPPPQFNEEDDSPATPRPWLSVAFIGSSLLWFWHFSLLYGLGEIACNSVRLGVPYFGVPLWQLLAILLTFAFGGVMAALALYGLRESVAPLGLRPEVRERQVFMGRVAVTIIALYGMVMAYMLVLTLLVPPCR